jgi:hypothetical protein
LTIQLTGTSYLRILNSRGAVVLLGIRRKGFARSFTGPRFAVTLGNAGAVLVSLRGRTPRTLGRTGQVVNFTAVR